MRGHILKYLEESEWVKRPELLGHLHSLGVETTDRQMRQEIQEMVINDGHCISSSEKGYKLIKDGNELNQAVAYLNEKAEAIAIRKNSLLRNFFSRYESEETKKQLNLFNNG